MTAVAMPSDHSGAIISDIQRMSTEDGPGIRTTVFFKGCTLSCRWCHNPESISLKPQVQWLGPRCIGCHTCIETCRNHALTVAPDGAICRDRHVCRVCGECVEACPARAMDMVGKRWHQDDLVSEVIKDRAFFEGSSGGIT